MWLSQKGTWKLGQRCVFQSYLGTQQNHYMHFKFFKLGTNSFAHHFIAEHVILFEAI